MKFILSVFLLIIVIVADAQQPRREAFDLLNLDYPGLEKVKTACSRQQWEEAAWELLAYYHNRTDIAHPDIDLKNLATSKEEWKWTDDTMDHTFFVHKGYQLPYNYGKDINWEYWPAKDNELRWQLHRHKWFTPMGRAYRIPGDEKYAKEWAFQYIDWIKKNPLVKMEKENFELVSAGEVKENADNVHFAWCQSKVSNCLQDQTCQLLLFCPTEASTSEFLTELLVNHHRHDVYLFKNYPAEDDHLLLEVQRMVHAGVFFPELEDAVTWRESGISILNRGIKKQVYDDGGQYELDPHYHLTAISIFCKALRMADCNDSRNESLAKCPDTVKRMIEFYTNVCFPDYINPYFSDARLGDYKSEFVNHRDWATLPSDSEQICYYTTEGREGASLSYLSHGPLASGFLTFRSGWKKDAAVVVVKAGPKGERHYRPDNGTLEFWFNGKNLFLGSGAHVYVGSDEATKLRNWFRQTRAHNILTLDGRNFETTQPVTKLWQPEGREQIPVTENPSYQGLRHRRTVFFVEQTYYVTADEAVGDARGTVNLSYHFCEGMIDVDVKKNMATTAYTGPNNVKPQCLPEKEAFLKKEEDWRPIAYRQRVPRTSLPFDIHKGDAEAVRYITVAYPMKDTASYPVLKVKSLNKDFDEKGVKVEVPVSGVARQLMSRLK